MHGKTLMHSIAEGEMMLRSTTDVKSIGIDKDLLISIGRFIQGEKIVSHANALSVKIDLLAGRSTCDGIGHGVITKNLFDGIAHQRRIISKLNELFPMLQKSEETERNLFAQKVISIAETNENEFDQLFPIDSSRFQLKRNSMESEEMKVNRPVR